MSIGTCCRCGALNPPTMYTADCSLCAGTPLTDDTISGVVNIGTGSDFARVPCNCAAKDAEIARLRAERDEAVEQLSCDGTEYRRLYHEQVIKCARLVKRNGELLSLPEIHDITKLQQACDQFQANSKLRKAERDDLRTRLDAALAALEMQPCGCSGGFVCTRCEGLGRAPCGRCDDGEVFDMTETRPDGLSIAAWLRTRKRLRCPSPGCSLAAALEVSDE